MVETEINTVKMKHLRRTAGKTKWDKIKNEDIRRLTNKEPTMKKQRRQTNSIAKKEQLAWLGNVARTKLN